MDTIGIERMRFEPEQGPSRRGWRLAVAAMLFIGAGAISTTAVDILGWRDALDDAKTVASDRNASERALTNASTVLHRHAQEAIDELLRIEARGGEAAKHAAIYLKKIHLQSQR